MTELNVRINDEALELSNIRNTDLRDAGHLNADSELRDPDGPLIPLIAEGDQNAARELVDRHIGKLFSVSYRLLKNKEDADEVVQEVFLKVWTHAEKWEPGRAKFGTWMHRVAINLCYDRLRKRREVTVDEVPDMPDESLGPAGDLQQKQVARHLREAMEGLPIRQRTAIELCHYQGFSNIESAEIMDVSVEAIESLLARGRRALRKALSEDARHLMGTVEG